MDPNLQASENLAGALTTVSGGEGGRGQATGGRAVAPPTDGHAVVVQLVAAAVLTHGQALLVQHAQQADGAQLLLLVLEAAGREAGARGRRQPGEGAEPAPQARGLRVRPRSSRGQHLCASPHAMALSPVLSLPSDARMRKCRLWV